MTTVIHSKAAPGPTPRFHIVQPGQKLHSEPSTVTVNVTFYDADTLPEDFVVPSSGSDTMHVLVQGSAGLEGCKEALEAALEALPATPAKTLPAVTTPVAVSPVGYVSQEQRRAEFSAFWKEFAPRFRWTLVPFTFVYDLYTAWVDATRPPGPRMGRQLFHAALRDHIVRDDKWFIPLDADGRPRTIRIKTLMSVPEPLIDEYGLTSWMRVGEQPPYSMRRGIIRRTYFHKPPRGHQ